MNSIHPPNATTIPLPSNNQSIPVAANSITPDTTKIPTKTIETLPTAKEQPAVPNNATMGPSNPNNSNNDAQKEIAKPIGGEQVPANQHGEHILDKKDSSSEVKSTVPQNSGDTGNGGKVNIPESSHTDTAPTPIDNNIEKAENTNHEQASVVHIN